MNPANDEPDEAMNPDEVTTLCTVEPGLVGHVRQLLTDAGVPSAALPQPDGRVCVVIDPAADEHARSVIGLVLPQLLDDAPRRTGSLSSRLIRTEDDPTALPGGLVDGTRLTFGYADPLADPPEDETADFVPPEPAPIPRPKDRIARAAWAAVLGGPLLILLVHAIGLPGFLSSVGVILFFGGFGTLVFRMEERNRSDDGWDDGAVV
ncbi:MAG: hypothetical protein V9E98_09005 [Candidatus Nanopelagicales bacterium]